MEVRSLSSYRKFIENTRFDVHALVKITLSGKAMSFVLYSKCFLTYSEDHTHCISLWRLKSKTVSVTFSTLSKRDCENMLVIFLIECKQSAPHSCAKCNNSVILWHKTLSCWKKDRMTSTWQRLQPWLDIMNIIMT